MEKQTLNSLDLEKETIAKLDESQLNQIVGGINNNADETTSMSGF